MKAFKSILSGFVIFLFGLEMGFYWAWYFTVIALQSNKSNRKHEHVSYREMTNHRCT